jgi:hypothetical protein
MFTTEKNPFEKFWSKIETAFEKFLPLESICKIYFTVFESVAYLGLVQENVTTFFNESATTGAIFVLELLKVAEEPLLYTIKGATFSHPNSTNAISVVKSKVLIKYFIC